MIEEKALTVPEPRAMAMEPIEQELKRAEVWIRSGLLPAHIKNPATAVIIVQRGRELGIPPIEALNCLYPVHGKVSCDTKTMLALAWRSGKLAKFEILESDDDHCKIRLQRVGNPPQEFQFKIQDADRLGVTKPTQKAPQKGLQYKSQPRVMLRWRAIAEGLRFTVPDALAGLYTHEEMNLPVKVQGEDFVLDSKAVVQQEGREAVKSEGATLQAELGDKFDDERPPDVPPDEPPPGYHDVPPLEPGVLNGEAEAADAQAAGEEAITREQMDKMTPLINKLELSHSDVELLKQSTTGPTGEHFTQAQAEQAYTWLKAAANPPACPDCGATMKHRLIETTEQKFAYEKGERKSKARPAFFCTNKVNGEWCNRSIWSRTGVEAERK